MGCSGCAKRAASRVGNSVNNPIILGEPIVGNSTHRASVLIGGNLGVLDGATKYVYGSLIQQFVDDGSIVLKSGVYGSIISEGRKWYQVGSLGYLTVAPAQVRSEQTGEEIVERTIGE